MDFSIAGSESWGSTSREDTFIENYFRKPKQSLSNLVASKKKKKSSELSEDFVEPAKKKKCLKSKALASEVSVTNTCSKTQAKEKGDVSYSKSKSLKTNNVSLGSMKPKLKKSKNKPEHASLVLLDSKLDKKAKKGVLKTNETVKNSCETVPLKVISLPHSKNTLKKKKSKRDFKNFQDISELSLQNTNVSSKISSSGNKNTKIPVKLASISKVTSNSEDESSEYSISDDCGSDEEVLREEIQNSSVFKQIRKLMKKAPHLNPSLENSEFTECSSPSPDVNDSADGDSADDSSDWSVTALSEEGSDEDLSVVTDEEDVESDSQVPNVNFECITNKQNHLIKQLGQNTGSKTKSNETVNRTSPIKNKKQETSNNLRNKAQQKLAAAKFRYLNEKLYTETGKEAFGYFQENEEEFKDYHTGYSLQVSKWPMNPVNEIISDLQKLKKTLVIADLGCGDAKIAQTFPDRTVHSFDLVPLNEFVRACDISKVPLSNESVDVVVFCLSLMGINLKEYLCEAFRILKLGGILKIAEVESRIENLEHFIKCLNSIGFTLQKQNTKHKIFVFLDLKKEKKKCKSKKVPDISLKPCLYKKR